MFAIPPLFQQWLLSLLSLPVNAAAGLPVIIALGLAAGRRGNASFCLSGNIRLLRFCFLLSLLGPVWYFLAYLTQILPFYSTGNILSPLFSLAGAGYGTSIASWLAGVVLLYMALLGLEKKPEPVAEKYKLAWVRPQLFLCLGAAVCFLLTFWLINWPFAGLPDGLPMDRAVLAVGRNAMRHYFMALCPAGAFGLILAFSTDIGSPIQQKNARRWLSAWATAGYMPHTLIALGSVIGLVLHGDLGGNLVPDLQIKTCGVIVLILAITCWLLILLDKSRRQWLAWAGLGLLVLYVSAPYLFRAF